MSFGDLLCKDLLEAWRRSRVLAVVVVFGFFGLASPLVAKFTPELIEAVAGEQAQALKAAIPTPTVKDAVDQYRKNLTQFGVVLALLLGMGAIAGERERGQLEMVFSRPVGRARYFVSKYAAMVIVFAAGLAVAAVGAAVYTSILFQPLDGRGWLAMNAGLLLRMAAGLALSFLASALTRTNLAAIGLGVALTALVAAPAMVPAIAGWLPSALGGAEALPMRALAGTVLVIALSVGAGAAAVRRLEP